MAAAISLPTYGTTRTKRGKSREAVVVGLVAGVRKRLINSTASLLDRGFTLLRLSEFTQISDFFSSNGGLLADM